MGVREAVEELVLLGPLPDSSAPIQRIEAHQRVLERISPPLSDDEAVLLLTCFGPDDCYGLAWTLLHLIETAPSGAPICTPPLPTDNKWIRTLWDRSHRQFEFDPSVLDEIVGLLRHKPAPSPCEAKLLEKLQTGAVVSHTRPHENLPADQLLATFTTRHQIEQLRRAETGEVLWNDLERLVAMLSALGETRPQTMTIESGRQTFIVFYVPRRSVAVICSGND